MEIGYIGLGVMGEPLVRRLLAHHRVRVFDLDRGAVDRLVEHGAVASDGVADLSQSVDLVFLCVPTSDHVRSIVLGEHGVLAHARRGTVIIDQTTGDPTVTRELARMAEDHGLGLIDAPISGRPEEILEGNVTIMVGADSKSFERTRSALESITDRIFHLGDVGTGQVMKLSNNMLSAIQRVVTLEAVALATKNGIEPATAVEVMLASSGRNFFMEKFLKPHIITGHLASGFTLGLQHKDMRLACQLGLDSSVVLPFGNLVREFLQMCINEHGRDTQVNAAALVMDRIQGTHVVPEDYSLE
ncbi:NAD(P)-dependent oxidoreductase [Saccharomonospora sp. NPDC046836]|uniref:NAD(P)-dependent oxidoreductase n=1 Tax=Saccharomonospora sp. NPDC046836 TaxID=3156921 RepID=UPI0033D3004F